MESIGITGAESEEGGVTFSGTTRELAIANLHLRTASRILVRVAQFHARSFQELERHAKRIDWNRFLGPTRTAAFRVTCKKSKLYHSDAVAERLMRWVGVPATTSAVEQDADAGNGPTGNGPTGNGQQLFIVRFFRDECTISADSSGEHLHRRGWRLASGKAPMRETLGAAMLLASGWDGSTPLIDPFCGSGTIPIEAALLARGIAPGRNRDFAFRHWPGHDDATWQQVLTETDAAVRPETGTPIHASDRDAGAIESAKANATRAGVANDITFETKPLSAIEPAENGAWLVANPPYGVRVGDKGALRNLYARIGQLATTQLKGGRIVILSAEHALEKATGLQLEELFRTTNGGVPVRCLATRSNG